LLQKYSFLHKNRRLESKKHAAIQKVLLALLLSIL